MNKIKTYKLFLEHKKATLSKKENDQVIEFLIAQERKSGLSFDTFEVLENENGMEILIVAKTKVYQNGEEPSEVTFDIIDFQTWLIEKENSIGKFDNIMRYGKNAKLVTLEEMKSVVLKHIIYHDTSNELKEPSIEEKKIIDKIFGHENVWDICKSKVSDMISVISKYDIEDMDDRTVEFSDEIFDWTPSIYFAWYYKNSWYSLNNKINDQTCRFIQDMRYNITTRGEIFDVCLSNIKPCLSIEFNAKSGGEFRYYNLLKVEDIIKRLVIRFQKLYDIEDVIYDYDPEERRYDPDIDISSYHLTIILK